MEEVRVRTYSFNETRHFRDWLRRLKDQPIRITDVKSIGGYETSITYEVIL